MNQTQGFFQSLFDFSFTSFITTKIVKLLYVLSMFGAGLLCLFLVVATFILDSTLGILVLIFVAPLVFLLEVTYARVALELIMVIFRVSEHTAEIAEQGRRKG